MHRFHFFRAGGVDQVSLRDGADLLALRDLDRKLWVALAMPIAHIDIDPATLALIDLAGDGRIRIDDILDVVAWVERTFKRPDDIVRSKDTIDLAAIKDEKVVGAARHMLRDLGKPASPTISVEDTVAIVKAFTGTVLNGDGIVVPGSAGDDADLKKAIEDAIACDLGPAVNDRSGAPGVDQARADALFAAVDKRVAWLAVGKAPELAPLGEGTAAAAAAFAAVRAKLDDFFTRCKVAAFDARGAAMLDSQDAALVALAARNLSPTDDELARLPLAHVEAAGKLPLGNVNPAWAARIATFQTACVAPVLGARDALVAADVAQIADKLAAYDAWFGAKPATAVDGLDVAWLDKLAEPALREKLRALILKDASLTTEYEEITSVAKAVRLQRDFGRILRNFVNFSDFYSRQDGTFQGGTLYLDARALHLCVRVADPARHLALAPSSDAYLIYFDISRQGEAPRQMVAALTNGDADNIFVGRNGIFYDREKRDWDATITKIITNPISIREAFWTPYKKLFKTIEETVTKRAAAADAESQEKVTAGGTMFGNVDKAATPASPVPPPKKIDLGTVAAIGVAIGGIGTLVGALLATIFGLGPWLPLGLLAILLMISGPSMLLAWLKLRRRNLGPILDANGWAINGRARINVAFGAAMTELARLPKGSQRTLDDPFADKRTPWRRWVVLAAIVVLAGTWYVGKLDSYLPSVIRSVNILGDGAPAAVRDVKLTQLKPPPPPPAPAPAPAKPATAPPPAPAPAPAPAKPAAPPAAGSGAPAPAPAPPPAGSGSALPTVGSGSAP
ncbi:MAG: hypothetical protein KF773_20835 [Deltaproteobacteria bacterium]|nr:hypothetical protein [Deltaproteobacteria bacterium]